MTYYLRAAAVYATFHRRMGISAIDETRRLLDQCLAMEPRFARAHGLYSPTKTTAWALELDDDHLNPKALADALRSAVTAVQLDANLPQAHSQLGYVLCLCGMPNAVTHFERAIEINSKSSRRLRLLRPTIELILSLCRSLGGGCSISGVYRGGTKSSTQPRLPHCRQCLLGEFDAARAQAQHILRLDPDFIAARTFRRMTSFWHPLDVEHFLEGLRKAGLPLE